MWDEMIDVICDAHRDAAHRHAREGGGVHIIMGHEVARVSRLSCVNCTPWSEGHRERQL